MNKKIQQRMLCILASVALAFTYMAIGFAVCAGFPQITRNLSSDNSAFDASPFAHDQLVDLACETRAFTVEGYARDAEGDDVANERYATRLISCAEASAADPEKGPLWSEEARSVLDAGSSGQMAPLDAMFALYRIDPSYALDADAIAHLDDVNDVAASARMPLLGCTMIAAFCLMALVMMFGPVAAGRALLYGGAGALALFAILGAWGLFGFDALFAWVHSLFFAEGSWVFPADSLLIQMYPAGFWIGMGAWWLCSSCVVAAASVVIGLIIIRKKTAAKEEPRQPAGLQA